MFDHFSLLEPRRHAVCRLFCFPYAGGTPWIYHGWPRRLPASVEVWVAQMAGRGARVNARPLATIAEIVDEFTPAIVEASHDRPLALFGHSMGALVAFELACRIRDRPPRVLFASGARAPYLRRDVPLLREAPDEELLAQLRELSGTPAAALDDPELMRLLLPAIRADFAAVETYNYAPRPPLDTRLVAIGGTDDPHVTGDDLAAWRQHTSRDFTTRRFNGDHFYIHHSGTAVCHLVAAELGVDHRVAFA